MTCICLHTHTLTHSVDLMLKIQNRKSQTKSGDNADQGQIWGFSFFPTVEMFQDRQGSRNSREIQCCTVYAVLATLKNSFHIFIARFKWCPGQVLLAVLVSLATILLLRHSQVLAIFIFFLFSFPPHAFVQHFFQSNPGKINYLSWIILALLLAFQVLVSFV